MPALNITLLDQLTANLNLLGDGGDNLLTGSALIDILDGGAGNDTLDGGLGIDLLSGGLGNDTFTVDTSLERIGEAPGAGIDTVAASVDFTLPGDVENLTLTGLAQIGGGNGENNLLTGNVALNTLNGGLGDDTLDGGVAADILIGGGGNDSFLVDDVGDVLTEVAGEGADGATASVNFTLPEFLEFLALTGAATIGVGNVEDNAVVGTDGANSLDGGLGDDTVIGRGGNDTMNGGGGNDTLVGGAGDDSQDGGSGTDSSQFSGNAMEYRFSVGPGGELVVTDTVAGRDGTDSLTGVEQLQFADREVGLGTGPGGAGGDLVLGTAGSDTVAARQDGTVYDLAGGSDTLDYSGLGANAVFASLCSFMTSRAGTSDILINVENVTGTAGDDAIVGNSAANTLFGLGGSDFLFGGCVDGSQSGNDILDGGADNDGLFALSGDDLVLGGGGDDGIVGGFGNDTLNGGEGQDFAFGGAFNADGTFAPNSGVDILNGGAETDALYGFDDADTLVGDAGNDILYGGDGNDLTQGAADNDFVLGEGGADTIGGGTGFDYMYGGAAADTFLFRFGDSYDSIFDFSLAEGDRLRLDPALGVDTLTEFQAIAFDASSDGRAATVINFFNATGSLDQLTIFGAAPGDFTAGSIDFF